MGGSSEYGYFSDYSSLYLGPDISYCPDESVTLDAGAGMTSYLWNTGATTQTLVTSTPGIYWVTVTQELCVLSDTLEIAHYPVTPVNLGADTALCQGQEITFDAGEGYRTYEWQDGSTRQTYTTGIPGVYWVTVQDENNCELTDSVLLTVHPLPPATLIKHY